MKDEERIKLGEEIASFCAEVQQDVGSMEALELAEYLEGLPDEAARETLERLQEGRPEPSEPYNVEEIDGASLSRQYGEELEQRLDFEAIREELQNGEVYKDVEGRKFRRVYLGRTYSFFPSGKHPSPWADQRTRKEVERDRIFWQTLESMCETYFDFHVQVRQSPADPTNLILQTEVYNG